MISLRKISIGKASGAKQYGSHDANMQITRNMITEASTLVNTPMPKTRSRRQYQRKPKGFY